MSEIRMVQTRRSASAPTTKSGGDSSFLSFEFRVSNLFRISRFGFRISTQNQHQYGIRPGKSCLALRLGLTQIEVVLASLIVGVVLVAAMRALPGVLQTRTIAAQMRVGNHLAEQLLTEILHSPYEDPEEPGRPLGLDAAEGSGNRSDWDDVDDYDSYSQSPPRDKAGNELTDFAGWTREVTVEYLDPADPLTTVLIDLGLKRVLVRVTSPGGEQTELWAMRSREGTLEQSLGASDATCIGWIGCQLQVGTNAEPVTGGTNLVNHAEDE